MRLCGLILAAGESSRLGKPKQLVKHGEKTLLEKAIESALEAPLEKVYVVLGARFEQIKSSIEHLPVSIIQNNHWKEGIGSSIRAGMESITGEDYDGVLIMLCDQLHVKSPHLNTLIHAYQAQQKGIIVTSYGNQLGVPALFNEKFFPNLKELRGDVGAKKMIQQYPEEVLPIPFEQAMIDIDTPDDLEILGLS